MTSKNETIERLACCLQEAIEGKNNAGMWHTALQEAQPFVNPAIDPESLKLVIHYDDMTPDEFTYSTQPYAKYNDTIVIDRQERGTMGRHEYRYIHLHNFDWQGQANWLKNEGKSDSQARREVYNRLQKWIDRCEDYGNSWGYVGLVLTAQQSNGDNLQESLWGIESDSGVEYMAEVVQELAGQMGLTIDKETAKSLVDSAKWE